MKQISDSHGEIKALQNLKKNINNSFNEAVIQFAKCQSKVILCGVGKSGLIASKIAATLSSVGTPSFSLSASDSSHGDLGSISKKDRTVQCASVMFINTKLIPIIHTIHLHLGC